MMTTVDKLFSLLIPIISTLVVILAITLDGKLITKGNKFNFKRIKPTAYVLISLTLFLNIYQVYNTNRTIKESKLQAKKQEFKDSIRIADLTQLAKTNLIKTDSVKVQLIDNTIKALDEQRQIAEREKENVFIHFQNEVKENLSKILFKYEEKTVKGFKDTTMFILTRVNHIYIDKYQSISNSKLIIEYLMETSEIIDKINNYADALTEESDKKIRAMDIRMFLSNIDILYTYMSNIYIRINDLKSYKEYESINFYKAPPVIDKEELYNTLYAEYLYENKETKNVKIYLKDNNVKFFNKDGKLIK